MNKKVIIPLFASAMGLSLLGGISGAVAWYQYNTRVTASYVGTSVAESGLLEIGKKVNDSFDYSQRDLFMATSGTLKAVTFGETAKNAALPGQAYYRPEAGVADMTKWQQATANTDYFQFDIYLKAEQFDNESNTMKQVAKDVYLSDLQISVAETSTKAEMAKAVRVHLDVDNGSKFLISNDAVTDLPVYGGLDLDQEAGNDKVGGYQWVDGRTNEIVYGYPDAGNEGKYQNTYGKSEVVNARDNNNHLTADASKKICTTSATANVKITVTVWIEGWAKLTTKANQAAADAIWDPAYGDDATVRVGMTFDVGDGAFSA